MARASGDEELLTTETKRATTSRGPIVLPRTIFRRCSSVRSRHLHFRDLDACAAPYVESECG